MNLEQLEIDDSARKTRRTHLHVKCSMCKKNGYNKATYKVQHQSSQDQSTQATQTLPYPSQSQASQPQAT